MLLRIEMLLSGVARPSAIFMWASNGYRPAGSVCSHDLKISRIAHRSVWGSEISVSLQKA